jgi:hypothetical protein
VADKPLLVGDLIKLKRAFAARLSHPQDTPDTLGYGIIIDKLTELFIFPHETALFDYNSKIDPTLFIDRQVENKSSIKTRICKVYWFSKSKSRWEYEDDIETAEEQKKV